MEIEFDPKKGVVTEVIHKGWQHDTSYTVDNGDGEEEVDAYAAGSGLHNVGDEITYESE